MVNNLCESCRFYFTHFSCCNTQITESGIYLITDLKQTFSGTLRYTPYEMSYKTRFSTLTLMNYY